MDYWNYVKCQQQCYILFRFNDETSWSPTGDLKCIKILLKSIYIKGLLTSKIPLYKVKYYGCVTSCS